MAIAQPVVVVEPYGETYRFDYRDPSKIVTCHSVKELKQLLDYYACPFIKRRVPDSVVARRRYVEKTRPALRWFCTKYGVEVPEWLKGNGPYDSMPDEEMEELFGTEPFKVFEFNEHHPEPE